MQFSAINLLPLAFCLAPVLGAPAPDVSDAAAAPADFNVLLEADAPLSAESSKNPSYVFHPAPVSEAERRENYQRCLASSVCPQVFPESCFCANQLRRDCAIKTGVERILVQDCRTQEYYVERLGPDGKFYREDYNKPCNKPCPYPCNYNNKPCNNNGRPCPRPCPQPCNKPGCDKPCPRPYYPNRVVDYDVDNVNYYNPVYRNNDGNDFEIIRDTKVIRYDAGDKYDNKYDSKYDSKYDAKYGRDYYNLN